MDNIPQREKATDKLLAEVNELMLEWHTEIAFQNSTFVYTEMNNIKHTYYCLKNNFCSWKMAYDLHHRMKELVNYMKRNPTNGIRRPDPPIPTLNTSIQRALANSAPIDGMSAHKFLTHRSRRASRRTRRRRPVFLESTLTEESEEAKEEKAEKPEKEKSVSSKNKTLNSQ